MIALAGANLLPSPPSNVAVAVFPLVAVVAVVDDVVVVVIIFGEGGAPLKMIEGLPHLVLVPVGPYPPKSTYLIFPHSGVINPKGVLCAPPPP